MNGRKLILIGIPVIFILLSVFLVIKGTVDGILPTMEKEETVLNHHMVVERLESLGKLELVKFYIKDIVEHSEKIRWWPDPKAIIIVSGEVVGCIDLVKIDTNDIVISGNQIVVSLPEPEICYHKVNHKESKIYDVSNLSLEEDAQLIDRAYKLAEAKLQEAALEMEIINQTRNNARLILKPILETLTNKKVILQFK